MENISEENEVSFSKEVTEKLETQDEKSLDLKEFGVDSDEPDLFNNENHTPSSENLPGLVEEEHDEDDLEIPAFLRRQKN